MSQSHHHLHNHHEVSHNKAFLIGIILNIAFVIIEVFYGFLANSSALLADAGHNAGDVLGLIFAWTAAYLATIKPKGKYTFGLRRTTILVSILNALLLFGAMGFIAYDAIIKVQNPQPIAGNQIMIVAGIGIVINTITALLFFRGKDKDLNIKGAFLHMAADAAVSAGVVVAGLLIKTTGALWIDPIMSFIIIIVILRGTWKLFIDSVNLALDAVPKDININDVRAYLLNYEGVKDLHDLHIWATSTTDVALTAHLHIPNEINDNFLIRLERELRDKFGINHTTFQIENSNMSKNCHTNCAE